MSRNYIKQLPIDNSYKHCKQIKRGYKPTLILMILLLKLSMTTTTSGASAGESVYSWLKFIQRSYTVLHVNL